MLGVLWLGGGAAIHRLHRLHRVHRLCVEADGSTSLGLGLFIVCQIALAHGGRVDAESKDGRTTFTVVLPRRTTLDKG